MVSPRPFWLDTVSEADFRLPRVAASDPRPRAAVAVIGGGIVGLACAHYLAAAGVEDVLVLERGRLLHEASAANGGGLWPGEQAPGPGVFHELGKTSHDLIRDFSREADADLEYRRNGVLELARSEEQAPVLRERVRERQAGGLRVEWLEPGEVLAEEPALNPACVFGAGLYPGDGHINPARLGAAFARSAQRLGARIVTDVAVQRIEVLDDRTRLHTSRGAVEAERVVVTAGPWTDELCRCFGLEMPIQPAKGQLVATAPLPPLLRRPVMGGFGVLQTLAGNVLSGGSVEFSGFDAEPREALREEIWEAAGELVPALRGVPLTHSWARFRPHTPDELPLVGFCDAGRRHVVAAGHYKNGLLLSAVTGRIVTDLLTRGGTSLPVAGLEPDRFTRRGGS
jgi:glycine oxidase